MKHVIEPFRRESARASINATHLKIDLYSNHLPSSVSDSCL